MSRMFRPEFLVSYKRRGLVPAAVDIGQILSQYLQT